MRRGGDCPWYVSAHAVRQYMALVRATDFDAASDELIEICAETARRYRNDPARVPRRTESGLLVYRGPRPRQLRIVVSMEKRPEGPKPAVVDVRR